MAKFRVELDKSACEGFGACVELCPQLFRLSDVDGKSILEGAKEIMREDEVVAETLERDELECIREAAEACPFNAIHITDTGTGQKLI